MSLIDTTSHKPPYVFEQVAELGRKAYVLSGVALKKKRRVIRVNIGLYKNGRMVKDYVKRTDMKLLSGEILDYASGIFSKAKMVRGILIETTDKIAPNLTVFLERILLKKPELKMRIYKGPLGVLLVRKPFSDTNIFDMPFEELESMDLSVIRKLPNIKKPVKPVSDEEDDETIDTSFEHMEHEEILKEAPYETWMKNSSIARYFHELEVPMEMVKYYKELEKATIDSETALEYSDGILAYTSPDFFKINDMLRGYSDVDIASTSYIGKSMEQLSRLFKIVKPLPENLWTLRSLHINDEKEKERYDKLTVGDYLVDTGVVSTSPRPYREDSEFMRILVPKGSHVLFVEEYTSFRGEFEILLPPGTVLKMVGETILPEGHRVRDFVYVGNIMDEVLDDFNKKLEKADKELDNIYKSLEPGDLIVDLGLLIDKAREDERFLVVFDGAKKDYVVHKLNKKYKIAHGWKEVQEYVVEWKGDMLSEGDVVVEGHGVSSICIRKVKEDGYLTTSINGTDMNFVSKEDFEEHLKFSSHNGVFIVKNSPYVRHTNFDIELPDSKEDVIMAIREGYPLFLFSTLYVKLNDIWLKITIGKRNVIETEDAADILFSYDYERILSSLKSVVIIKEKPREVTVEEAMNMPEDNFVVEVVQGAFVLVKGKQIKGEDGIRIIHIPMFV